MDLILPLAGLMFLIATVSLLGAIARPGIRLPLAIIALASGILCAAFTHVLFEGGVVVGDPGGRLKSASIVQGGRVAEMRHVGWGYYYGEPGGDASLRLIYSDGSVAEGCYFTAGMPTYVDATPPLSC